MTPIFLFGDSRRAELRGSLEARVGHWWREWLGESLPVPALEMLSSQPPRPSIEERLSVALCDGDTVLGVVDGSPAILATVQPQWYAEDEPSSAPRHGNAVERGVVVEMLGALLQRIAGHAGAFSLKVGQRASDAFSEGVPPAVAFKVSVAPPWHELRCWLRADVMDDLLGPRPAAINNELPIARSDCIGELPVMIEGVVGEAHVGWAELKALQVGDVIVTDVRLDTMVSLAMRESSQLLGRGALGQKGGMRVVRIETGERGA